MTCVGKSSRVLCFSSSVFTNNYYYVVKKIIMWQALERSTKSQGFGFIYIYIYLD